MAPISFCISIYFIESKTYMTIKYHLKSDKDQI